MNESQKLINDIVEIIMAQGHDPAEILSGVKVGLSSSIKGKIASQSKQMDNLRSQFESLKRI